MKLELKHIAPYLPYGLKGNYELSEVIPSAEFELRKKELRTDNIHFFLSYAKPILRPLSDLTKKEFNEINNSIHKSIKVDLVLEHLKLGRLKFKDLPYEVFDWFLSKHFDVFGLIEKGLAININSLP